MCWPFETEHQCHPLEKENVETKQKKKMKNGRNID